jgi:HEAT repeats
VASFVIAILVIVSGVHIASANDRVAELTKLLASSSNEKTRLTAVVALARIGDKTALKPLVTALGDPSAKIRVVAAVALGRLGHKAALPSLRTAANDDADADVRTRSREAAILIAKTNRLPDPFDGNATAVPQAEPKRVKSGFGTHPRALEARPDLYVVIKTSADDSPGKADKKTRQAHADIIRYSLAEQCRSAPNVTSLASEAGKYGLNLKNIDLSVVKLDVTTSGGYMEIEASLRLAVSDDKGKMLSFLSGGAKVQVPRKTFDPKFLPNLRKEALENAMRGMFDKLLVHLRAQPRA